MNIIFVIRSLKLFAYYANELFSEVSSCACAKKWRVVQLMTGFDWITKDKNITETTVRFCLNDPVTIMIFDTDHKLPTYLQNVKDHNRDWIV